MVLYPTWITVVIPELIHATKLRPFPGKERLYLIKTNWLRLLAGLTIGLMTLDNP